MSEHINLLERFNMAELIGKGVSSHVYKALDNQTKTLVAIKHIHPHITNDPISVERFRRELQITRKLDHPNAIKIYDLFDSTNGIYLVMELLEGKDLQSFISFQGPLAIDRALILIKQLLSVLEACHRADIIHRDIKPQNIFVLDDGNIKVLDFGISRMSSMSDLTQTGTSMGSPEYMAPELFSINVYDPRTDIYAVGVVFYELLTGVKPFDGESIAELFKQHLEANPKSLKDHGIDCPEWLEKCLHKMVAKKPIARYQSAAEVLFDIQGQRVVTDTIKPLKRIPCLECDQPTLADLPICLQCGFDAGSLLSDSDSPAKVKSKKDKNFDLWLPPKIPSQKVKRWLNKVFPDRDVGLPANKRVKLFSNISPELAQFLKQNAAQNGVFLNAEQKNLKNFLTRNLGLMAMSAIIFYNAVEYFWNIFAPIYHQNARNQWEITNRWPSGFAEVKRVAEISLAQIPNSILNLASVTESIMPIVIPITLIVLMGFCILKFFSSLYAAYAHVFDMHGADGGQNLKWYPKFKKFIFTKKSPILREQEMATLESFLMITQSGILRADDINKLEIVTESSLKIISAMNLVDQKMAQLRAELGSASRIQQSPEYFEYEAKYSQLNNQLILIQSHYNILAGQLIVEKSVDIADRLLLLQDAVVRGQIASQFSAVAA